ncbi:ImpF [Acidisarcina polymorpha]|uniref:ImpF n=1 Tax=Acidisarcina polymorpha TaxID=2211140 RepID=A0A2Z5G2X0_9BACT|nr:type VI secretion system baseplate subunit TssE [Acidisarcina polymorpha]AXC13370.1 ImpF [Acidisarcina polymorpha]
MARSKEMLFAQSLMERLSEKQEWPTTQTGSLRLLKESIRRDLEALLNTRRPMTMELGGYSEAAASVVNYGLEDLTSLRATRSGYLLEMQRSIQQCLTEYEPRLTEVTVRVQDGDFVNREIRLHIEANLPVYPSVEAVTFDTVFDLTSETYFVG